MGYAFEEDFNSGIPAGFASNGGYGGITATWNEEARAVDLVFNGNQNFWRLNSAPQATDFCIEMDVEIRAASWTPPHFGFWLYDGVGSYEGQRVAVYNGNWAYSSWSSSGVESEAVYRAWAGWAVIGARRTLRLEVKRYVNTGAWLLQLSVDGEIVWRDARRGCATFQPAVFGYGVTLRLHRIAGDANSGLEDEPVVTHRGLPMALGHRILVPENAAMAGYRHRALRSLIGMRNHYYHGGHRIAGTVKRRQQGVNADVPLARRVLLIDQLTCAVVRQTWSDADSGAYSFDYIAAQPRYMVIAFDHQQRYRAVIADNLCAQPMLELAQ
jgi:hypothetical protein